MRKMLVTSLLVGVLVPALLVAPAGAISTYNSSPAPERTETGVFLALFDTNGDSTLDRLDWVCSGAMVDGETFLTAAHCTDFWPAGTRLFVSLTEDVQGVLDTAAGLGLSGEDAAAWAIGAGHMVEGAPHQDPAYPGNSADSHDIAVIELPSGAAAERWTFVPARLPTAGQLSRLGSRRLDALDWWVVGYGLQEAQRGPGGQTHPGGGIRRKAPVDFNALNKTWVRLSMVQSRGNGGACYGDSGGPNFVELDGALVLAGVTISGDTPCYATNDAYRTDSASARAFLAPFVALP